MGNPYAQFDTERLPVIPASPVPAPDEVRRWWDEYAMLDNIRAHSEMVCKVALLISDWLAGAGVFLNRPAVEAGALAHDLAKAPCLGTDQMHFLVGEEMVAAKGYPEIGYIVRTHVFLPKGHPLDEALIVNYADKRVMHDGVVDLDSRFDDILVRYAKGHPDRAKRIEFGRDRAKEIEAQIFSPMHGRHEPDEITRILGERQ